MDSPTERMPIACVHCAKAKAKCDKKVSESSREGIASYQRDTLSANSFCAALRVSTFGRDVSDQRHCASLSVF